MALRVFRKTWIIDSNQYKVLAIIILYILLALLISGAMIFLPSITSLVSDQPPEQQQQAAFEMLLLHERFWPTILIVTIILGLHSVFIFHKIFGPLYRFRTIFNNVAEGDLSTLIKIRKKDFLKSEEIAIRQMVTSLNTQAGLLQKTHHELQHNLLALKEKVETTEDLTQAELLTQLATLESMCSEMDTNLRHFRT